MVDSVSECWEDGGSPRVGAMAWWRHNPRPGENQQRPLPHLVVMTPAGLACLDCPTSDNPNSYWTRTGDPPAVTVTPSLNINHEQWHGHVTNGELVP